MLVEEKLSVINKLDALYKSKLGLEYMLRAFDQQDPKMVQNVKEQVHRTEKEIELYSKIRETLNDCIRELETELKIDDKNISSSNLSKSSSSRIAFSLFNYNAIEPTHLPLKKGDRVELLDCTDEDWWFGRLATGAEGCFPRSYVQEIKETDLQTEIEQSKKTARISEYSLPPENHAVNKQLFAKVLFEYEGRSEKELSLKPGEIIKILSTEGEEWFEGELNGKIGFFPVLYVEILSDNPVFTSSGNRSRSASNVASPSLSPSSSIKPVAVGKVMFDYSAKSEVELTVKPGDIVKIISLSDEEWAEAEFGGKYGFIPKLYVEIFENDSLPPPPPSSSDGKQIVESEVVTSSLVTPTKIQGSEISQDFHRNFAVRAIKTYEPKQLGEISFEVGDILCVLDASGDDWWEGTNTNGQHGFFPSSHVEKMKPTVSTNNSTANNSAVISTSSSSSSLSMSGSVMMTNSTTEKSMHEKLKLLEQMQQETDYGTFPAPEISQNLTHKPSETPRHKPEITVPTTTLQILPETLELMKKKLSETDLEPKKTKEKEILPLPRDLMRSRSSIFAKLLIPTSISPPVPTISAPSELPKLSTVNAEMVYKHQMVKEVQDTMEWMKKLLLENMKNGQNTLEKVDENFGILENQNLMALNQLKLDLNAKMQFFVKNVTEMMSEFYHENSNETVIKLSKEISKLKQEKQELKVKLSEKEEELSLFGTCDPSSISEIKGLLYSEQKKTSRLQQELFETREKLKIEPLILELVKLKQKCEFFETKIIQIKNLITNFGEKLSQEKVVPMGLALQYLVFLYQKITLRLKEIKEKIQVSHPLFVEVKEIQDYSATFEKYLVILQPLIEELTSKVSARALHQNSTFWKDLEIL